MARVDDDLCQSQHAYQSDPLFPGYRRGTHDRTASRQGRGCGGENLYTGGSLGDVAEGRGMAELDGSTTLEVLCDEIAQLALWGVQAGLSFYSIVIYTASSLSLAWMNFTMRVGARCESSRPCPLLYFHPRVCSLGSPWRYCLRGCEPRRSPARREATTATS